MCPPSPFSYKTNAFKLRKSLILTYLQGAPIVMNLKIIEILCKAILQKAMIVNPRRKIKTHLLHRYTEMTKKVSQLMVYLVQMEEKGHYVKIVEPNLEYNNRLHVMHYTCLISTWSLLVRVSTLHSHFHITCPLGRNTIFLMAHNKAN